MTQTPKDPDILSDPHAQAWRRGELEGGPTMTPQPMTDTPSADEIEAAYREGWSERGRWGLEQEDHRTIPAAERLERDWNSSDAKNDAFVRSTIASPAGEVGEMPVALAKAIESMTAQSANNVDTFMLTNECGNAMLERLAASDTEAMRLLDCEELSIAHGQQVSITFKDPADAFALFNELKSRAALAKGGAA